MIKISVFLLAGGLGSRLYPLTGGRGYILFYSDTKKKVRKY